MTAITCKNTWMGTCLAAAFWVQAFLIGTLWGAENDLSPVEVARLFERAFVDAAEKVSPSVVVVRVSHKEESNPSLQQNHPFWELLPPEYRDQLEEQWKEWQENHPPAPRRGPPQFDGQGSGVIIRKEGHILTNRHVVEGADKIKVQMLDGKIYDATIRGEDVQSDLAVLKIEADSLPVARIGDSAKVKVGQFAIAIGTPYELEYSVTFGHVSAKGRSSLIMDATMDQDFIQTDANINPGNSGGPLIDIEGNVIGINTLIRGLRTGIGFAIPINLAIEVADKLIQDGKYVRAWLGIGILALRNHQQYRRLVQDISEGIVVTQIRRDGPAFGSDLRPNDIITAVDGERVVTEPQLKALIRAKPIGEPVTLDVHRLDAEFHGQNIKVEVRPTAWPDQVVTLSPPAVAPQDAAARALGLKVELLTKELIDAYEIEGVEGVIITAVEKGTPADFSGLKPGDVITEVNQKPVKTPREFQEALKEADLKQGVILNYTSRGSSSFQILKEESE